MYHTLTEMLRTEGKKKHMLELNVLAILLQQANWFPIGYRITNCVGHC